MLQEKEFKAFVKTAKEVWRTVAFLLLELKLTLKIWVWKPGTTNKDKILVSQYLNTTRSHYTHRCARTIMLTSLLRN
jgi:hypothetical protein